MRILLHACCGPCTTFPLKSLRELGEEVAGFFYNPNIHPFKEYQRRLETFQDFSRQADLEAVIQDDYALEDFLQATAFRENMRCRYCYYLRLDATAKYAKEKGFDAFSTTLLVSPYQNHELIKSIGEEAAAKHQISFAYHDFRPGFREGVEMAKEMMLYRQPYCGCIYSERDRYRKIKK